MKRKISLILCIALVVALGVGTFQTGANWYLREHTKYMNIYDDNTVAPDQAITRGELAYAIYNILPDNRRTHQAQEAPFSDVSLEHMYVNEIDYCLEEGIINGYPDGTFDPEGALTRAEFATIISRATGLRENLRDVKAPDIEGHWAFGYINVSIEEGYMKGYPDGTFQPENSITRAEVATTLNRVYSRVLETDQAIRDPELVRLIQSRQLYIVDMKQMFIDLPMDHWAYDEMMEACVSHEFYWDQLDGRELWTKLLDNVTFIDSNSYTGIPVQ